MCMKQCQVPKDWRTWLVVAECKRTGDAVTRRMEAQGNPNSGQVCPIEYNMG